MDYDIAIVGYGPVGATAAALLGGQGLRVVVIERMAGIYDKPRAITADHEIMRVMQFAGIGAELGAHIRPHPGTQYLGVDGEPIKRTDVIPPPYPLGWPTGIHFIQPEYEAMLRGAVARHDNIDVLLSHELVSFQDFGDRIALEVEDLAGPQPRTIHVRYLLACDGANSSVRRRLGIGYEDLAFDEWWVVVDAWQQRPTLLPDMNTQYCWPSRPASAIVGPRNLRRWELKILPHEMPESFHDQARVREVLADFVDVDAFELWRSAVYRFHALVASQWISNRIFLLGDCAHQMPPFLGQGMCAGIRDAGNLIWKILLVEQAAARAVEFADRSMEMVAYATYWASTELAEERGRYASFQGSLWDRGVLPQDTLDLLAAERGGYVELDRSASLDWAALRGRIQKHGMRNSNCIAIAPTATIAITGSGLNQRTSAVAF